MFGLLWTLFLGGLAGWLAGRFMNSEGSALRNVILGLAGGVVGSIVFGIFGFAGRGLIGGTIVSVVGACILIWIGRRLG